MRLNLLTNRVILGVLVIFIGVGVWEFHFKPQYKPFYEDAVRDYQHGEYLQALPKIEKAYDIAPNALDVVIMRGWILLKLNRFEEARIFFDRAIRLDPRAEEAQIGAGFVAIETGRGTINPSLIEKIMGNRRGDPGVRMVAAAALEQSGQNLRAAELYRSLLDDKSYGSSARIALEDMYGMRGFDDPMPEVFPPYQKPASMQVPFRAAGQYMWSRSGSGGWNKFYVKGVDLGVGAPGYYPTSPPREGDMYTNWLTAAEQMNANTIRVYHLLPPAFYRALKHQIDAGRKLTLYQQIWIDDPPKDNLYNPDYVAKTKAEIRYVVDAMHGRGDVPPSRTRGNGVFSNDISAQVGGYLLGRQLQPSVAIQTNILNVGKRDYEGKYISISGGNATEVWFAEMLDYLIGYEADTYNWQHPVAIVNWPSLDPMSHPTESSRVPAGQQPNLANASDDNDLVSIDISKLKQSPEFQAGLFASYDVFPYYPEFMLKDPGYLRVSDGQGPNPYFGYLRDLKAHVPYPLVISEYGIPSSIGVTHLHPLGWNQGGHSEAEQQQLLLRMTQNIEQAGAAGGIVFSLMDEWYRRSWLTADLQDPQERKPLWLDDMTPEERYGLIGFHTSKWKLFAGSGWEQATTLYTNPGVPSTTDLGRNLRSVQYDADEGYLYLRLKLECVECPTGRGKLERPSFAIAFNTLPRPAGISQLPFGVKLLHGANFLLHIAADKARLLVADNYLPYEIVPSVGTPNKTEFHYRRVYTAQLEQTGTFVDSVVETNEPRYGRNGVFYPGLRYDRTELKYGSGNPASPDYDSTAQWYVDTRSKAILIRIPWGQLFVVDPSKPTVLTGYYSNLKPQSIPTRGIETTVFALNDGADLNKATVAGSLPAASNGTVPNPQLITWKGWNSIAPEIYYKKAYYALQKQFAEESVASAGAGNGDAGRTRTGRGPAGRQ